jgi:ferredoxin
MEVAHFGTDTLACPSGVAARAPRRAIMAFEGWTIRIENCGHEVRAAAGLRLLVALARDGVSCVRIGCFGGGCGACNVLVIEGSGRTGRMSRRHVSAEEEAERWVLACRLIPESDLVIRAIVSGHETLSVSPERSG